MESQSFDIQAGMAVYRANGEKIGNVVEIAGFGSTQIPKAADSDQSSVGSVTQASSGTGYFTLDCAAVLGTGDMNLCVPFRGIQDIVPGHGVILNDAVIVELRRQSHLEGPNAVARGQSPQRRWHEWRPGRRQ